MVRVNKFIRFEELDLKKLYVGKSNVRAENVSDGLDDLSEHIYVNGLLEPPVVFAVDDLSKSHELYQTRQEFKGKYEILAGQRRFTAFKILNEKYPGEGFDKIPCHIRKPPENDLDAKAISIGENLTQLPMTLQDSINAVSALFDKFPDERVVSKKFGISIQMVRKFVKVARLPPLLKEQLGVLNKNPKTATNIALDANDALEYDPANVEEVKRVIELAKKLAEKKKKSQSEYVKLKQAAAENPTKSVSVIVKASEKIKNPKKFIIPLDGNTSYALESSAEENGRTPEEEGADIIVNSLETRITSNISDSD